MIYAVGEDWSDKWGSIERPIAKSSKTTLHKKKLLLMYVIDGREEKVVAFRLRALENFHRKSQEKTAYIHPIPHPRVPRGKDLEILLYIYELINLMEYYIRQAVNGAIMVI